MDDRLELADRLLKMGKIKEARPVLEAFLKDNRNHIAGWQLYADAWPTAEDKKRVWGYCLRFNPENAQAQQALTALEAGPRKIEPAPAAIHAVQNKKAARSTTWMVIGAPALFAICVMIGAFYILDSRPKDASPYKHEQPVEYYLYVPDDYSADRAWPLFVGIHGAGGTGLDCWDLWQPYAEEEGFILLCPSIPGEGGGYFQDVGERTVWSAIQDVRAQYSVRPRMFMAGFSAGAFFVQGFAYHYPDSVSGLSVLSTAYYITGIDPDIPILVLVGGADHPQNVGASEEFAGHLQQNGYDVQYEVMAGVGHWVSNKAKTLTIELFRKTIEN